MAASQTATAPPVLTLRDARLVLNGAQGPVPVLNGISADFRASEIVAVTGRSGSGKSSLLSVAAGLQPLTEGSVRLLGQELRGLSEDALAWVRRCGPDGGGVGIVFQAFHLMANLDALDNVRVAVETAGRASGKAARELAAEALARMGLSGRMRHYPSQLSGGEQQRVAVARAIAPGPRIVFADEPTGNLDAQAGAQVRDLLFAAARERGAALFLVTHEAELAAACDRVIRLDDGRIVS